MRSTLIPQNLPSSIAPISIRSIQDGLANAQIELTTGRWSDVGYKLAEQTGPLLNVRAQINTIDTFDNTNSIATTRTDVLQNSLASIAGEAQIFFDAIVANRNTQVDSSITEQVAKESFSSVFSAINTSVNGVFVFSGINSDTGPLQDYFSTPQPASKTAVDAAFFAEFGFTQSDPAVSGITPAAMETFVDNAFAAVFDLAAWKTDWSTATDESVQTQISFNEFSQTTISANESAIRKLAMAYTMVADLGITLQNDTTLEMLMGKAIELAGEVIGDVSILRGTVGITQQRLEVTKDNLTIQKNAFEKVVGEKENVDSYEVATRISALTTQLEASYGLTARLQQLSLVKYI